MLTGYLDTNEQRTGRIDLRYPTSLNNSKTKYIQRLHRESTGSACVCRTTCSCYYICSVLLCRCAGRPSCVTCDIGEAQLDWFRGLSWWTLYRWHTGALTFIYFGNSPENHLSKVFFNVEKTQATYEKVLGGHCRPTVGPTSRLHVVMFQALTERC